MIDLVYINPNDFEANELRDIIHTLGGIQIESIFFDCSELVPSCIPEMLYWSSIENLVPMIGINADSLKDDIVLLYSISDNCKLVHLNNEEAIIKKLKNELESRKNDCLVLTNTEN